VVTSLDNLASVHRQPLPRRPGSEGPAVGVFVEFHPIGNYDKKSDAVDRARDVAKKQPSSQVVVRMQDGTIQTEYTYGDDPFPPRG
jgi:hypothetical protein